ncbi:formylglycine-generating enzyme family protein [Cohnella thailandensis]|uniref:Formylglycine-generating enzyme family protein n=1 Tax=Cohnella thailandensis TaxID=557557 RepID=A0A841SYJ3_9BACL|nr:formylglycine-generating enzyme family protein [Cohnella thailandensis]MBB6634910.1 formylglycine-generating enzyme family protein [Cohnella thailandensis]MBP1975868.1 formylglycine-generating enzyme required for sulfatase activity [Cohnella thailandensis]
MEGKENGELKPCCAARRDGAEGGDPLIAVSSFGRLKANKASQAEPEKGGTRREEPPMVYLSGGVFLMGTEDKEGFPSDGEGPVREVEVAPFYIDKYSVTNAEFAIFVEATGYVTEAERYGWSYVFHLFVSKATAAGVRQQVYRTPWWWVVEGADWRHPEGPDSDIRDRLDHPVIHVSFTDAEAYCAWAGKRLPTEAEWEYAARGGLEQKRFPWGDELEPHGEHRCNVWQGQFPHVNNAADGYAGTAPVHAYEPNGYGLCNMVGNVWEFCSDWFDISHSLPGASAERCVNPKGPENGVSKVMKGGSYLCHDSYCNRYRVAARSSNTPDSSAGNMGFRCARSADM